MMNEESLNKKAYKNLLILFVCGLLLICADLIAAGMQNHVTVEEGKNGLVLIRPDVKAGAGNIRLRAEVHGEYADVTKVLNISIKPYSPESGAGDETTDVSSASADEVPPEELIVYEMRSIASSLNEDRSIRKLNLPSELANGEKVKWTVERSTNTVSLTFVLILAAIAIYRNRLNPLKKLKQRRQGSITRQLPEFINRIVLLLNAGLVLNQAFVMSTERYAAPSDEEKHDNRKKEGYFDDRDKEDYFYAKMREISAKMYETNSSMTAEFKDFATECRSLDSEIAKELMRISNIFSDNISKGVELTDKLQCESEMLWLNRKRDCEERGRLAETKQTLPLTLFLLVLIVITVSPALLEL